MAEADAITSLTPFDDAAGSGASGAILFDHARLGQARPEWMTPAFWGERAQPVASGGRGGAWYLDAPFGPALLRHYRRGGLVAHFNHDRYLWRGANRTRGFLEYHLTGRLLELGLPVPRPLAAVYWRAGASWYRAALLLERLPQVRTLAQNLWWAGAAPPWEAAGRTIARFHRAGLEHADLNLHNVLIDAAGRIWLIDFDRSRLRTPHRHWREANLRRLRRSLLKLRGDQRRTQALAEYARLRDGYDDGWERGR